MGRSSIQASNATATNTNTKPTAGPRNSNTVGVVTTGIADDIRCISDIDQLAKKIIIELLAIERQIKQDGGKISEIVVAGPPCIAKSVDRHTPSWVCVSHNHLSFERFLNDEGETGDGYEIPSVVGERPTIAQVLASMGKLSDDSVDEYDLTDNWDQARIAGDVIRKMNPDRYERAKQKAQSKRVERLMNDWFDRIPTVDGLLVVGDGKHTMDHIVSHATAGDNQWIKYPTKCAGPVRSVTMGVQEGECLSQLQAAVFDPRCLRRLNYDKLPTKAFDRIEQWITEGGRQQIGFQPQLGCSSPTEPKTAVTTKQTNIGNTNQAQA